MDLSLFPAADFPAADFPAADLCAEPAAPAQPARGSAALNSAAARAPQEPLQHPDIWRADQLRPSRLPAWPSGYQALDAALPGGGWPAQALTELLLPHPGVGELRLLAPVQAAVQASSPAAAHTLMWFDPPALPCAWALRALGVDVQRLVLVHAHPSPAQACPPAEDMLWALEQALHSGCAGVVLAWLPVHLPPHALRRLQLAAQAHEGPVFLLRGAAAAAQVSPAVLRLSLLPAGPDSLCLRVLKRRGPPARSTVQLHLPPVLSATAAARARSWLQAPKGAVGPVGLGGRGGARRPAVARALP